MFYVTFSFIIMIFACDSPSCLWVLNFFYIKNFSHNLNKYELRENMLVHCCFVFIIKMNIFAYNFSSVYIKKKKKKQAN